MELSILQHAKDKAPRHVTLDEVVGQIRGDQWPAGYRPFLLIQGVYEGGCLQKQLTRTSIPVPTSAGRIRIHMP